MSIVFCFKYNVKNILLIDQTRMHHISGNSGLGIFCTHFKNIKILREIFLCQLDIGG